MDLLDRYLNAVAAQLPTDERADIVAELRDLILSRFEAREEALGRPLTDEEQEAILHEIGHPLVVAARYRKGPDALIGPELFPYWLFGVKAGLLVLLAVHAILLLVRLVSGPADVGQAIAQAFHSFFGAGLTLIGAATLAGAIFEHYGVRPAWLTRWRVRELSTFGLSDPAAWGAAMGATASGKTAPDAATPPAVARPRGWPGGEHLFGLLATAMFVLWWVGVLHVPGLGVFELRGETVRVAGAPVWTTLFLPILIYALIQASVHLDGVLRPQAARMRALAEIPLAAAGLWLIWVVLEAGHWFTLSAGGETARIEGGRALLTLATLEALGGDRHDLSGWASSMSAVMTWALALAAVGLGVHMVDRLWRLVRG